MGKISGWRKTIKGFYWTHRTSFVEFNTIGLHKHLLPSVGSNNYKKVRKVLKRNTVRVRGQYEYLSILYFFAQQRRKQRYDEGANSDRVVAADHVLASIHARQWPNIPVLSRLDEWQTIRSISGVRRTLWSTLEYWWHRLQLQVTICWFITIAWIFFINFLFLSYVQKAFRTVSAVGTVIVATVRLSCLRIRFDTECGSNAGLNHIAFVSTTTS